MPGKVKRQAKTVSLQDATDQAKSSLQYKSGQPLHQQAEKILREKGTMSLKNLETLSSEEILNAFHELQVHQIELEMQNDELHRTQVELNIARDRYFDLYELAPVGYCTLSEKGLIMETNLTFATMLGEARKALIKRPLSRFIFKEDQDIYYLHSQQFIQTQAASQQHQAQISPEHSPEQQILDLRMNKKDGTKFWAHLKMIATRDADNAFIFQVALSDISERKQVEKIQKAESLQRMAGAITHIFNNQLCIVLGNLEMTLKDMEGDALPNQYLVDAMQAARRSSEVSTLLLTYLGQNIGKAEPLDLSTICRENLPRIEAAIPSAIAVTTDFLSPGPIIYANANQIQQVLLQLITNSWEAIGDSAGQVRVTTKTLPRADIPKSHLTPTDCQSLPRFFACLEVTDTGCGMTGTEMDRVFDPFFSTKFTGRGLGLAVVAGLVKAWNGMTSIESTVGKGSTFRVYLPLVAGAAPRQIGLLTKLKNPTSERTVLLVEDNHMVRILVESLLKRLGITVFTAESGDEAVSIFKKHQDNIDCLLTDLCMPGMDGWETLAALRKIKPDLPAILSSGYDETHAMSGDYSEQPQAFLQKPFLMEDLKNVLNRILGDAAPSAA